MSSGLARCSSFFRLSVNTTSHSQERLKGITSYLAQTSLELKNDPIKFRWSNVTVTLRNVFFGHGSRIHTLIMTKMSHTCLTRYNDEVMMFYVQKVQGQLHIITFCKNPFLDITQYLNSGAEGETGTIFHIWFDTDLVTLVLDARCRDLLCCWVERVTEAHIFKNSQLLIVPSESALLAKRVNAYKECDSFFCFSQWTCTLIDTQLFSTTSSQFVFRNWASGDHILLLLVLNDTFVQVFSVEHFNSQ